MIIAQSYELNHLSIMDIMDIMDTINFAQPKRPAVRL